MNSKKKRKILEFKKIYDNYINNKYSYVYNPLHERSTITGYVLEHIIVAENMLGRSLKDDEEVHHINFNKKDNSPENLLVCNRQEHTLIHTSFKSLKLHKNQIYFDKEKRLYLKK